MRKSDCLLGSTVFFWTYPSSLRWAEGLVVKLEKGWATVQFDLPNTPCVRRTIAYSALWPSLKQLVAKEKARCRAHMKLIQERLYKLNGLA